MIEVLKIDNFYLRNFVLDNVSSKSISENDYIKYALDYCLDGFCQKLNDLPDKLNERGIELSQYKTKDGYYKLSYKTERLNYGISEDKLGKKYSYISLYNNFNKLKNCDDIKDELNDINDVFENNDTISNDKSMADR